MSPFIDLHKYTIEEVRERIEKETNELIEEFLADYEEVRKRLVGIKIPYGVIIKINSLKEKWEAKKNEDT